MEATDEGAVETMGFNRLDQLHRRASQQRQLDVGVLLAVLGQHLRQADGGSGFHRTQTKQAGRATGVHQYAATFIGQLQDAPRITEERLTRRGQHHPGLLADEQFPVQFGL